MMIFHDSRSEIYRIPGGAVPCAGKVTLRVRAEHAARVRLRVWWNDAEELYPMREVSPGLYEYQMQAPDAPGVLWYYFCTEDDRGERWFCGNAADGLGGAGEAGRTEPASFQMTVYDSAYRTPTWLRNGAMMQIMVDRFCASREPDVRRLPMGSYYHTRWSDDPVLVADDRSGEYVNNDYFGGDLKGVEQKLEYLRDLGITVIYLNPIFRANSNHKYNTGDYMAVDPAFGTEQDFRDLCAEARKLGVRIVLDGVFSHTGTDSVYFNKNGNYGAGGAYSDPNSPYAKWYLFRQWPDDYDCWWGVRTLPNVNKGDPEYRKFIISGEDSVAAHWLREGASGWRLDVADELPMDFLSALRERVKEVDPDAAIIGEVWEDPSNKVSYGKMRCYCTGDTLDGAMNYPLREAVLAFLRSRIDAGTFVRRVENLQENLPKPFFYSEMNLLGSHDKPRALSVLADVGDLEPERRFRRAFDLAPEAYARGRRRLIAAWRLICALPGIPCVYYGDEAGLYGMTDPFCRGTYPWGREDKALVAEFRDALHRRAACDALRTGALRLTACGADVVLVHREIAHGRDALGDAAENGVCDLAVNRAETSRWIEHDGRAVEVPAESAVWLADKER